jgi:protein ImuB
MPCERIACVDVPALSLQLVLRKHPAWVQEPVAIVEDDRPLATVLWPNRTARTLGIARGMRLSEARALSAKLHAQVVPEHEVTTAIDALLDRLLAFCPHVEPSLAEPGLFWLDPNGLDGLFGNPERWGRRIHDVLHADRWVASIVIGFQRGGVYAIARTRTGVHVLSSPEHERQRSDRVPLSRLGIAPALNKELALLGIHTVGALRRLPCTQLRTRYGRDAAQLHAFFDGRSWTPILPRIPNAPVVLTAELDPPDDDQARLLFVLRGALIEAFPVLAQKHEAIVALVLVLRLERGNAHEERIETAAPTLDVTQIIDLVRLRLATVTLTDHVERLTATLERVLVHPRQLAIAHGPRQRDLEAAARALARLRASFGPNAVTRARACEAHLPEAAFRYEPTTDVRRPRASPLNGKPPLVRRVLSMPRPLPPPPTHEPERWLGPHGAVRTMLGPYRVAGGWWSPRGARERDYHFVETRNGTILWVYYDRVRRRWFLHGFVD